MKLFNRFLIAIILFFAFCPFVHAAEYSELTTDCTNTGAGYNFSSWDHHGTYIDTGSHTSVTGFSMWIGQGTSAPANDFRIKLFADHSGDLDTAVLTYCDIPAADIDAGGNLETCTLDTPYSVTEDTVYFLMGTPVNAADNANYKSYLSQTPGTDKFWLAKETSTWYDNSADYPICFKVTFETEISPTPTPSSSSTIDFNSATTALWAIHSDLRDMVSIFMFLFALTFLSVSFYVYFKFYRRFNA